ncbi:precorrin-2 dehydrogenase/sirohydrochlorin ferrochelatase family protein [Effusibacillus lacus]|uniref:precorrin-2 dehydrogenase n=1 Tax=Effusibacillus lacus TaxID=1348429 RepID=A0A292YQ23_9BACL|nr:bifunctional precorrin-2 dehydrogenase/sirohydrochlorin ferrochelatase [Effusibacillus lacus]GAX90504.1 siroheme synthase [Effusibacillus lacus]
MDSRYFAAFLDIAGRLCTVIGGGQVAERKIKTLLACGARIRIVSPGLTPELGRLAAEGAIEHIARPYEPGDTEGAFLTIAATDSREVNRLVVEEVNKEGRLVNSVHGAAEANLIFPAVVDRGPLQVAISTSGTGPVVAKAIREDLEEYFGEEFEVYLHKLSSVREHLKQTIDEEKMRAEVLLAIVQSRVRELLRSGNEAEADRIIRSIIEGQGNS